MSQVAATVLARARSQLGVVTHRQLREEGLSRGQIQHCLQTGLLVAVFRGVYASGGQPSTLDVRVTAACLACGAEAFASHDTALALLGLIAAEIDVIHVTTPTDVRVRLPGLRAHRSALVGVRERSVRNGLHVSRPARALIDSAGREDLEVVVDAALRLRIVTPRTLLTEASRPEFAKRPGIAVLRELARDRLGEGRSESELEDRMVRLLRAHALPQPTRQFEARLGGRDVRFDLAYPDHHLAIELDGWAPHFGRDRWQRDHDRRNAAELAGWRMLEFTWQDVTDRPWLVVSSLADALALRPLRWTAAK